MALNLAQNPNPTFSITGDGDIQHSLRVGLHPPEPAGDAAVNPEGTRLGTALSAALSVAARSRPASRPWPCPSAPC